MLIRSPGAVLLQDVSSGMVEVDFSFPRREGRKRPFQCVSYRTAMKPPRPRTDWWPLVLPTLYITLIHYANVAIEDVVWRHFVAVFVQDVPRQISRHETRGAGIVLSDARLTAFHRNTRACRRGSPSAGTLSASGRLPGAEAAEPTPKT